MHYSARECDERDSGRQTHRGLPREGGCRVRGGLRLLHCLRRPVRYPRFNRQRRGRGQCLGDGLDVPHDSGHQWFVFLPFHGLFFFLWWKMCTWFFSSGFTDSWYCFTGSDCLVDERDAWLVECFEERVRTLHPGRAGTACLSENEVGALIYHLSATFPLQRIKQRIKVGKNAGSSTGN